MNDLTFSEYFGRPYPYQLVLNDTNEGMYVVHSHLLSWFISSQPLVGKYVELDTRLTAYQFSNKADAMLIKLGWDSNQIKWETVSGPGW